MRGTVLGAADASQYHSWPTRMAVKNGKIVNVPKEEWRQLPAEDQLDAVLYLGKSEGETQARWSPQLCVDQEYMKMRLARIALAAPPSEAEQLKAYCASVAK